MARKLGGALMLGHKVVEDSPVDQSCTELVIAKVDQLLLQLRNGGDVNGGRAHVDDEDDAAQQLRSNMQFAAIAGRPGTRHAIRRRWSRHAGPASRSSVA